MQARTQEDADDLDHIRMKEMTLTHECIRHGRQSRCVLSIHAESMVAPCHFIFSKLEFGWEIF